VRDDAIGPRVAPRSAEEVAMPIRAATITLVFATACFGPSPKAAYQRDVQAMLAAHPASSRTIAAGGLQLQPWRVGQWALYKTSNNGKLGYERLAIVAADDCGMWIEQVRQDAYHRTVNKICYASMPNITDQRGTPIDVMDLWQVLISQGDKGRPMVWDLRRDPNARRGMKMMVQSLVSFGWLGNDSLPREDIDVPAGRFHGAARFPAKISALFTTIDVTAMMHGEVPIYGLVRETASNGYSLELVAYGQDGATSELSATTNTPGTYSVLPGQQPASSAHLCPAGTMYTADGKKGACILDAGADVTLGATLGLQGKCPAGQTARGFFLDGGTNNPICVPGKDTIAPGAYSVLPGQPPADPAQLCPAGTLYSAAGKYGACIFDPPNTAAAQAKQLSVVCSKGTPRGFYLEGGTNNPLCTPPKR
jgi:hypothetical protein